MAKKKKKKQKRRVDNRMRNYGDYDPNTGVIRVNKKASRAYGKRYKVAGILDTIVHEEIHKKHPKMGERKVVKRTKKKVKRMTKKQKSKHYLRYSILRGKKKK